MKIGNVFATKKIVQLTNTGTQTWVAGRNQTFICLMLGVEPTKDVHDSDLIQPSEVLKALGWKPTKKANEGDGTIGDDLGELTRVIVLTGLEI